MVTDLDGDDPNAAPDVATSDVAALRGAPVEVDARRAGRVAVGMLVVALFGLSAALFVSGARKNDQVTDLRDHGIAVAVTVTSCRGLLGGSGSNFVGYTCEGTYRVRGQRYRQTLPTNTLYAAGTRVTLVAAADDPALLSTRALVAARHASWRVYLVPSALLVLVAGVGALSWRRRRASRKDPLPR